MLPLILELVLALVFILIYAFEAEYCRDRNARRIFIIVSLIVNILLSIIKFLY